MPEDRYASFDYRSLIAWDDRLKREWPLFDELLRSAPSNRILDLGSGTGDHTRLFASQGYEVVGIDSSDAMLEKSRAAAPEIAYVKGDMREIDQVVDGGKTRDEPSRLVKYPGSACDRRELVVAPQLHRAPPAVWARI